MEIRKLPPFLADIYCPPSKIFIRLFVCLFFILFVQYNLYAQDRRPLSDSLALICLNIASLPESQQAEEIDRIVAKSAVNQAHALQIRKTLTKFVDGVRIFRMSQDETVN